MRANMGNPMPGVHQLSKMVRSPLFLILPLKGAALNNTPLDRIRRLRHSLEDDEYRKYNLWLEKNEKLKYRSLLEAPDFQPWVALAGLVVDLLLVFVISPAGWWREPVTPAGFFAAYAGVSLLQADTTR